MIKTRNINYLNNNNNTIYSYLKFQTHEFILEKLDEQRYIVGTQTTGGISLIDIVLDNVRRFNPVPLDYHADTIFLFYHWENDCQLIVYVLSVLKYKLKVVQYTVYYWSSHRPCVRPPDLENGPIMANPSKLITYPLRNSTNPYLAGSEIISLQFPLKYDKMFWYPSVPYIYINKGVNGFTTSKQEFEIDSKYIYSYNGSPSIYIEGKLYLLFDRDKKSYTVDPNAFIPRIISNEFHELRVSLTLYDDDITHVKYYYGTVNENIIDIKMVKMEYEPIGKSHRPSTRFDLQPPPRATWDPHPQYVPGFILSTPDVLECIVPEDKKRIFLFPWFSNRRPQTTEIFEENDDEL